MKIKKMRKEMEEIKEEDVIGEVKFEIDKDAFKGPFPCCKKKTQKVMKKMVMEDFEFSYEVWRCFKCKKEFLDTQQAQKLEKIWTIEKIFNEKLISIERNVNYDGKTFFVRFPIEVTKKWHKGSHADITLLSSKEFFIKIKT